MLVVGVLVVVGMMVEIFRKDFGEDSSDIEQREESGNFEPVHGLGSDQEVKGQDQQADAEDFNHWWLCRYLRAIDMVPLRFG